MIKQINIYPEVGLFLTALMHSHGSLLLSP